MRANWCCAGPICASRGRRSPACCGRGRRAWLAAFAARIENGRLTIGQLAFTGIDATLATLDTGALSASGTAQFSGQDWHFTARLTAAGSDGAAGLNVTLDGQGKANGLGASFAGQLAHDGTLAGTIAGRGPNLAVLLPAPPVPFRAEGRLTVGSGLAAVDDLALEIGGSPASGAVALRVGAEPAARHRAGGQPARPRCLAAGAAARRHHDRRDRRADRDRRLGGGGAVWRRHAGTRAGGVRSDRQGPCRARGQRVAARQRQSCD